MINGLSKSIEVPTTNLGSDVIINGAENNKEKNIAILKNNYIAKYYKGLGTNTAAEGRSYFKAFNQYHKKEFQNSLGTDNIIDLAFNKKRSDDRKNWLLNDYNELSFVEPSKLKLTYEEFFGKDFIHFSQADIIRSIPSVIDGLKPTQRKILYGCFKKNLIAKEMKVVQLAGYIAEQTCYHHSDSSLHNTIVNMAQDYVGSNNCPLLIPSGQFGTRALVRYKHDLSE